MAAGVETRVMGTEAPAMRLSDLSRRLPKEIWHTFEPILPPVVWCGNGRRPWDNRAVLHGLLFVLVSGIGWEMVPLGFPSGKTIRRRLKRWLELDCFRTAWAGLVEKYERLRGINWDKVLLDGSKHKAPKGGRVRELLRSIALSAARPCTWRPMSTACPSGPP
jgi:transposase